MYVLSVMTSDADAKFVVGAVSILGAVLVTVLIAIVIGLLVFYFLGMYRLYEKLGLKGWYVFIPFYGVWKLYEVIGLEWYWFLIYIVPLMLMLSNQYMPAYLVLISSVASLAAIYNIAKKFNKSKGWIILAFFFEEIALPLLGLDDDEKCDDTVVTTPNAMFDDKKENKVKTKVKKISKKIEEKVKPKEDK